jgi:hypothetical protein
MNLDQKINNCQSFKSIQPIFDEIIHKHEIKYINEKTQKDLLEKNRRLDMCKLILTGFNKNGSVNYKDLTKYDYSENEIKEIINEYFEIDKISYNDGIYEIIINKN